MTFGRLPRPASRRRPRRARPSQRLQVDGLEPRLAMSATTPAVVLDSATTTNSLGVTIDYDVITPPDVTHPLVFGVYRSADGAFSPDDVPVGSETIVPPGPGAPTLDDSGAPAAAEGHHQLTIPLPGGLPINPLHPYVLVVADPGSPAATTDPSQTASFRKDVIGVVTHGGLESAGWKRGPLWQLEIARLMRQEGYNSVIAYNWVAQSNTPGAAARQGPRLARMILQVAGQFPPSDPVDLHFIGHSEGTVVNTMAIVRLESEMTPQLRAGYLQDTLLDPHAANNDLPGRQYSDSGGPLGWLARGLIGDYQGRARDPRVFVPPGVDDAEVFYQHSSAGHATGNDGIYNLWGQVPVPGPSVHYFNLTDLGATHTGKTGVQYWYLHNVVPTLGDGEPWVRAQVLTGGLETAGPAPSSRGPSEVTTHRPTFAGTAAPDSTVRLWIGPADEPWVLAPAGRAVVGPDGRWSITSRPLADGRDRTVVDDAPDLRTSGPRLALMPTAPLGPVVVAAPGDVSA